MDYSILSLFVESTIPCGVTFNSCGVALRGLRCILAKDKFKVFFDMCAVNGVWGGALKIDGYMWYVSSPLTRRGVKFSRFEDCADYLWEQALPIISRNGPKMLPYFKKEHAAWKLLSTEQKYSLFKETSYYF